jgi:hypothetical protein
LAVAATGPSVVGAAGKTDVSVSEGAVRVGSVTAGAVGFDWLPLTVTSGLVLVPEPPVESVDGPPAEAAVVPPSVFCELVTLTSGVLEPLAEVAPPVLLPVTEGATPTVSAGSVPDPVEGDAVAASPPLVVPPVGSSALPVLNRTGASVPVPVVPVTCVPDPLTETVLAPLPVPAVPPPDAEPPVVPPASALVPPDVEPIPVPPVSAAVVAPPVVPLPVAVALPESDAVALPLPAARPSVLSDAEPLTPPLPPNGAMPPTLRRVPSEPHAARDNNASAATLRRRVFFTGLRMELSFVSLPRASR